MAMSRLWLCWLGLALLLGGCGFHLRGDLALPPELQRVALTGTSPNSALGIDIHQALVAAGGEGVTGDAAQATARLVIHTEQFDKRVLSVNSLGQASEYELHYRLRYELQSRTGSTLAGVQQLDRLRDYVFDPANVLGKGAEEALLKQEMRRQAVARMLERLRRTCCTTSAAERR